MKTRLDVPHDLSDEVWPRPVNDRPADAGRTIREIERELIAMTETEIRNRNIVETVCQAFNDHDADGILAHFADDAVWLLSRGAPPDGVTLRGKAEIRAMLDRRFSSIPDMAWEIHSHWAGGDRACSEWTVTGTEANGERLEWLGCDLWRLDADGRVVRKDTYWKYAGGES